MGLVFNTVFSEDESDSEYLINVHKAFKFSCNDLVLIALLSGGNYDEGIQGCSIQTAAEITQTGIGKQLFDALEISEVNDYPAVTALWCQDLCIILEAKGAGHLSSHHCSLASRIPSDFSKVLVLIQYLHPVTLGLENLPTTLLLAQPDLSRLAKICEELFIWGNSIGIVKNFLHHIFPGLAIHELLQDLLCAVHPNQCEQSESEIFVSLVIPYAILTQITSVLNKSHETDANRKALIQFMEKHEVHVWLSHILALHAQPNILDNVDQTCKPAKRCKSMKQPLKQIEPSQNSIASSSTNNVSSHQVQVEHTHALLVLEISSDESGNEMAAPCPEATPRKHQKHAKSPKYRLELQIQRKSWRTFKQHQRASKKAQPLHMIDSVMAQFNAFLAEEKVVLQGTDIFIERQLHPKIDYYIVGFIMQGCNNVDMHSVSKAPDEPQKSYSYAQKLWASTTYGFHKGGRGKVPWDQATASGNPSISDVVSSYMLGLQKCKVAKGEIPMTLFLQGTLRRFYNHNHDPQNWNASPETPGNWCGGNVQKLLQAVYLITFTCLLWIDKALKIQLHDIEFGNDNVDGTHFVSITLPFCKSSPFGDIPPFVLCALPKDIAHLCPVQALADWIVTSNITHGYLFPNIDKCDHPITVKNTAMKPEVFLQLFRNNLCNLGEPPYAYGTQSFHHGGCQWLSVDLC
ncbi:hypothetical protein ARMGADRAFT_1033682 [Armillaria gallica]|uniref:Uncharacterized protein n=1 Tax=Armillaria gallica TaxID=47427 RepID=A0A2H3D1H0_ARMGA|nr:hypothetical protein ARMGADRAFT_1033682 [Armillaria gallica]